MSKNQRTIIDFEYTNDNFWPNIEAWTNQKCFKLQAAKSSENTKVYQKGHGFWVAPMMFQVSKESNHVHIETWIRIPTINRVITFFLLPAEMPCDSSKFTGAIPKSMLRKAVNELLIVFNQPLIS